LKSIYYKKH